MEWVPLKVGRDHFGTKTLPPPGMKHRLKTRITSRAAATAISFQEERGKRVRFYPSFDTWSAKKTVKWEAAKRERCFWPQVQRGRGKKAIAAAENDVGKGAYKWMATV